MPGETDLEKLIAGLRPELSAGEYVFVSVHSATDSLPALATVVEDEGLSVVLTREDADRLRLSYDFVAAWITLRVHSSLDAVGLTATVSARLADVDISCNVIAGYYHDHLLVPYERAQDAVTELEALVRRCLRPIDHGRYRSPG